MLLIAEVLMVLLQSKTNDSVEMAVTALKESGALLQDNEPAMLRAYATLQPLLTPAVLLHPSTRIRPLVNSLCPTCKQQDELCARSTPVRRLLVLLWTPRSEESDQARPDVLDVWNGSFSEVSPLSRRPVQTLDVPHQVPGRWTMHADDWMRNCWPCRIMDEMRTVLQEGRVEQRVQYIVEGLFKVQRDGFEKSGHSQVPEGLDLLDDADKFEVEVDLETAPDIQQTLNIFKYDPDYEQHEKEWEVRARQSTSLAASPGEADMMHKGSAVGKCGACT